LKFACTDHSGAYRIGCWISHRSTASLLVLKSLGAAAGITRRHSGGGPRTEKKILPSYTILRPAVAPQTWLSVVNKSPCRSRAIAFESLKGTGFSPYVNLLKRTGFSP
jgi:hypothetical protein